MLPIYVLVKAVRTLNHFRQRCQSLLIWKLFIWSKLTATKTEFEICGDIVADVVSTHVLAHFRSCMSYRLKKYMLHTFTLLYVFQREKLKGVGTFDCCNFGHLDKKWYKG